MNRFVIAALAALSFAAPVFADNSLLIISNGNRTTYDALTGGAELQDLSNRFGALGITASIAAREDAFGIRQAFLNFANNLDQGTEDVAIVLTGRFVTTAAGSYLLPTNNAHNLSLAQVVTFGFPLDAVFAIAAEYPGQALVVLGDTQTDAPNTAVLQGIPQGVTVAVGSGDAAARFANRLTRPLGGDILAELRRAKLTVAGYVPRRLSLLQSPEGDLPVVIEEDNSAYQAAANAAWRTAVQANTEAAYEAYIAAYPRGANAAEARQRLAAIRSEPFFREKQVEQALNLSRNTRREIQRQLSLLGYNTRGIDGIFGRGTRSAVKSWQEANGFAGSGYLSEGQINRLDVQAERRAAALEVEARERQAAQERLDRSFWADTGATGDEAGFRAYLNRFPDGVFSEVAQNRLAEIEAQRRNDAENSDRAIWQRARAADTPEAYKSYLAQRPNGAFADEAQLRIEWFINNADLVAARKKGEADEAALGLNAAGRRIVESRLSAAGLNPGAVDGRFDEDTRRAIRRYQDARQLRVSGYLDQSTMVRLMADAILR